MILVESDLAKFRLSDLITKKEDLIKEYQKKGAKLTMSDNFEKREQHKIEYGLVSFENDELAQAKLQIYQMEGISSDIRIALQELEHQLEIINDQLNIFVNVLKGR